MTKELYKKVLLAAKCSTPNKQDADDVCQEIFLMWEEYKKRNGCLPKQSIAQAIIDAKRRLWGDDRNKVAKERQAMRYGVDPTPQEGYKEPTQHFVYYDKIPEKLSDYGIDKDQFIKSLPLNWQKVFDLYLVKEFSQDDIAKKMGVTQARIMQIYKKILKRLEKVLKKNGHG